VEVMKEVEEVKELKEGN